MPLIKLEEYRKKPVIVRGVKVTRQNGLDVADWCGGHWKPHGFSGLPFGEPFLDVATSMGLPIARLGDHVIQGVCGEFYVSVPEVFSQAYDIVGEYLPANP